MTRVARFIGLCLLVCANVVGAGSDAREAGAEPVPRSYFGLHAHRLAQPQPWLPEGHRLTPWPSFSFGSLRLWDAYVAWPNLQPARDRWDFATLDRYVDAAQARGVSLVLPLGLSPDWASARPDEASSYRPGNAAEPADLQDWRVYVRTVAERYRGRIRFYELWNEINLKSFYSGSLATMVELARVAHEEIRQADPAAQLLTPSITEAQHVDWLDRYLALGGGRYADIVSYHFYTPKQSPEAMLPAVRSVKAVMRKHGLAGMPLWNTEAGWWIANLSPTERKGAAQASWLKLDSAQASAYVARALILGRAAGLDRYHWYAWDNQDMGLYDTVAREEKPAAQAYARVAGWMTARTLKGCAENDGVWVCELMDTDGKQMRIAWREKGVARDHAVPEQWSARSVEELGGRVSPVEGSVWLDGHPVLIR